MLHFFFLVCFNFYLYAAAGGASAGRQPADAVAYFFDVGQGHCFFFKSNRDDVAILIDAGSSKHPVLNLPTAKQKSEQTDAQKTRAIRQKQEYIRTTISDSIQASTKFICIVTHGDADHYNWLKELMDSLQVQPSQLLFIFGGGQRDYTRNKLPSVTQNGALAQHAQLPNPFYVSDNSGTDIRAINACLSNFLGRSNVSAAILSANHDSTDKNENSIVTRVAYSLPIASQAQPDAAAAAAIAAPEAISFMIPGDAPGSITREIVRQAGEDRVNLQSTVLLASHHGATTDSSNNLEWFNAVQPEYVIFGHGDRVDYLHPHAQAVQNALAVVERVAQPQEDHEIFYSCREGERMVRQDRSYTFADFTSRYRLMLTNCNVFSTHTQGDIEFRITGDSMNVSWNKKTSLQSADAAPDRLSPPVRMIQAYVTGRGSSQEITDLYFANQPDMAKQFLAIARQSRLPVLKSIDLNNVLFDEGEQNELVNFVRSNLQIKDLQVTDNVPPIRAAQDDDAQPYANRLRAAWNNGSGLDDLILVK